MTSLASTVAHLQRTAPEMAAFMAVAGAWLLLTWGVCAAWAAIARAVRQ
jgi:hypothetical protein